MRQYSKSFNLPENQQKRRLNAQKAAGVRWAKDFATRERIKPAPEKLFRITFENLVTGKETKVEINKGTRANNFRFLVNGKPWKLCGMRQAENLILDSLAKAQ